MILKLGHAYRFKNGNRYTMFLYCGKINNKRLIKHLDGTNKIELVNDNYCDGKKVEEIQPYIEQFRLLAKHYKEDFKNEK